MLPTLVIRSARTARSCRYWPVLQRSTQRTPAATPSRPFSRTPITFIGKDVDEKIEEIQELYATARDEYEIAFEETEKVSVYAEDDRKAAREELDKVEKAYQEALEGKDGEEIRRRIGQRIRELKNAVQNMETMAQNQD